MLNTSGENVEKCRNSNPELRVCKISCCFFTHLSYYSALEGLCAVLPAPLAAPSRMSVTKSYSTALVQGDRAGQPRLTIRGGRKAEVEV